jgi:hypothetical protein
VRVTDAAGAAYDETFEIAVGDVNEGPTDLVFGGNSIALNDAGGHAHYLKAVDGSRVLGGREAFTIEMQFVSDGPASDLDTLLSYATPGKDNELIIGSRGGQVRVWLKGQEIATGIDEQLLFDGEPHQISMSWTNTDGRLQLHVDGEQEFERTGIATGASLASGGTLIFGQEQDSLNGGFDTAQYFGGSYQDVRVFDHVRNQAEINDNLLVDIDPDTSGLVANWRMNDLDAGRTTDALGSGNDLTVVVARGITAGVAPRQATVLLENAADGTVVATVTGADPDLAETLTYSLLDDAGGRFTINAATGEITVADGTLLDVESAASHAVTVRVTDADGLAYDETYTVDLTDVNEGPTSMT